MDPTAGMIWQATNTMVGLLFLSATLSFSLFLFLFFSFSVDLSNSLVPSFSPPLLPPPFSSLPPFFSQVYMKSQCFPSQMTPILR